jgi:Predicted transmembrane transcriptional regulator (anti-sigma factor)
MNNSSTCERASDLIAFVYKEASESEARDFELHLKQCSNCRDEVASFGSVRESITAWKHEALAGFVPAPPATRKSALAALRHFFDLSPLWLKGATAFAVVAFCVLAALAIVRLQTPQPTVASANSGAVYTEQDVNRIVKEALAKQQDTKPPVETPQIVVKSPVVKSLVVKSPKPKRIVEPSQMAKSRRPLSRAEREQLAADLRLLSTHEEASLNLLGDRINQ